MDHDYMFGAPRSTSAPSTRSQNNTVVYLTRKDLRASDNPILYHLSQSRSHGFTHLLPVYVFPPHQMEVSGFIPGHTIKYAAASGETKPQNVGTRDDGETARAQSLRTCPYPEARSRHGKFWRCGPHRAKFTAHSVWSLQQSLKSLGSGLVLRIGYYDEVVRSLVEQLRSQNLHVGAVWMTAEEGVEEKEDEKKVQKACQDLGVGMKLWTNAPKSRDLNFSSPQGLPDIFTTYRKSVEPLRSKPRFMVPAPSARSLPPMPALLPPQALPFVIPDDLDGLVDAMVRPVAEFMPRLTKPGEPTSLDSGYTLPPPMPPGTESTHPLTGGEGSAHARLGVVIRSGGAGRYKATRNGLLGVDFSTKLSAYLAIGCITARQVHWALAAYEEGDWSWEKWGAETGLTRLFGRENGWDALGATGGSDVPQPEYNIAHKNAGGSILGYGQGESEGTAAIRVELLWRDYMRLCSRKFGGRLFAIGGFRNGRKLNWRTVSTSQAYGAADATSETARLPPTGPAASLPPSPQPTKHILNRCLHGTTGQSLIDATARELILTGYTSNRARQNFVSFLAKHLVIDWRLGAEWYECCLVDYDVSSNWANWQYVAGVGNDPRGDARIFNPVKQGFDYDAQGMYLKAWVEEIRGLGVIDENTKSQDEETTASSATDEGDSGAARPTFPTGSRRNSGGGVSPGASSQNKAAKFEDGSQPVKKLESMLQPWIAPREEWSRLGWDRMTWDKKEMWEQPVLRIDFRVQRRPGNSRHFFRRRTGGVTGERRGGAGAPAAVAVGNTGRADGHQRYGHNCCRDNSRSSGYYNGMHRGLGGNRPVVQRQGDDRRPGHGGMGQYHQGPGPPGGNGSTYQIPQQAGYYGGGPGGMVGGYYPGGVGMANVGYLHGGNGGPWMHDVDQYGASDGYHINIGGGYHNGGPPPPHHGGYGGGHGYLAFGPGVGQAGRTRRML